MQFFASVLAAGRTIIVHKIKQLKWKHRINSRYYFLRSIHAMVCGYMFIFLQIKIWKKLKNNTENCNVFHNGRYVWLSIWENDKKMTSIFEAFDSVFCNRRVFIARKLLFGWMCERKMKCWFLIPILPKLHYSYWEENKNFKFIWNCSRYILKKIKGFCLIVSLLQFASKIKIFCWWLITW
jgi:hypothetical protein